MLWRTWLANDEVAALRFLVEYNLYDAFQLKPLMERIFNKTRDRELSGAPRLAETERGDLLYDVSRLILALGRDSEPARPLAVDG